MIQRIEDAVLVAAFVVGFLMLGGPSALRLFIWVLAIATAACLAGRFHARGQGGTHPPRAR